MMKERYGAGDPLLSIVGPRGAVDFPLSVEVPQLKK